MRTKFRTLKWYRSAYVALALAISAAGLLPALTGEALAFGRVTSRSLQMTTSLPGTAATYTTTFTPASSTQIQGMVLDFCSNNPIIGVSCTAPTGFSVGTPTATVSTTGETGLTWSAAMANTNRTLELTSTGAAAGTPTAVTITLTTATNPSGSAGTFYARIFTFAASASVASWNSDTSLTTSDGTAGDGSSVLNVLDAGGLALATENTISITATVQETLQFCISATAFTGANCAGMSTPPIAIAIGNGTPKVLDSNSVYTSPAYTQASSNANSGVAVDMSNSSGCTNGGLKSGTNCIQGIGAFGAITAGTAAFGLNVANSVGGSGNMNANAAYGPTANNYGMTSGVLTPPGDQIMKSTAPINGVDNTLTFAATASNTTPAGIYSGNYQLVATGTF